MTLFCKITCQCHPKILKVVDVYLYYSHVYIYEYRTHATATGYIIIDITMRHIVAAAIRPHPTLNIFPVSVKYLCPGFSVPLIF